MEILFAEKNDIQQIAEIEKRYIECAWSEDMLNDAYDNPRYFFLKATKNNQILGYISLELITPDANICNIAVTEKARAKGIGSMLVTQALNFLKQQGIERVLLEVAKDNLAALSLYEKAGFKNIAVRPFYYGKNSALVMEKLL